MNLFVHIADLCLAADYPAGLRNHQCLRLVQGGDAVQVAGVEQLDKQSCHLLRRTRGHRSTLPGLFIRTNI
jgi:hypothetical protein